MAERFLGTVCGPWPQPVRDDFVSPGPVHGTVVDGAATLTPGRHLTGS
ncbi:hypothetical protein ACIREM_33545 [Streptomyces shenzhenensis]